MTVRFNIAAVNYMNKTSGAVSATMGGLAAPARGVYADLNRICDTTKPVRGLMLFKGTMPTVSELDAIDSTVYSTLASAFRYTDMLIQFAPTTAPSYTNDLTNFSLLPARPLQAGVATWFMFGVFNNNGVADNHFYICGTVGTADSELNLLTTTFSTSQLYRLPQFSFQTPRKLTF